jgi:hypothetical protein
VSHLPTSLPNRVQRTILDVEKPLVQQKLDDVQTALSRGQTELNWKVGAALMQECVIAVLTWNTLILCHVIILSCITRQQRSTPSSLPR